MTIPGNIGITAQEAMDGVTDLMRNVRLQEQYADCYEPLRSVNESKRVAIPTWYGIPISKTLLDSMEDCIGCILLHGGLCFPALCEAHRELLNKEANALRFLMGNDCMWGPDSTQAAIDIYREFCKTTFESARWLNIDQMKILDRLNSGEPVPVAEISDVLYGYVSNEYQFRCGLNGHIIDIPIVKW